MPQASGATESSQRRSPAVALLPVTSSQIAAVGYDAATASW
jgi:hypothetical protein